MRLTDRATRKKVCVLLGALLLFSGLASCRDPGWNEAAALTGGHPERGRAAIGRYGCGSCHRIPGIPGAEGLVGPPLAEVARRSYVGGVLTNTPDHLAQWIQNPQQFSPRTAMPNLGVTADEARDITAYLYTLK